ncbi:unnamed protein product [Meloidogyne enterolobii]|uniref:Uncharacterized protein n=1 Tax=Meloidogyne enterolobii TaxID=390850 RepID=A0ACB0ZMR9_MELEN
MFKNILLIIFPIINLNLILIIQAPPPMHEFILEYEYYSLNNILMNHMLPNMLAELRQTVFANAYKAIDFARGKFQEANRPANPNSPLHLRQQINDGNIVLGKYDFILYHPNQNNQIRNLTVNQVHSNGILQIGEYQQMNGGGFSDQFNQNIKIRRSGTIDIFYYIRCQHVNNIERFEYSEIHRIIKNNLTINFGQQITHRAIDGTIISILQARPQNYNIN